MSLRRNPTIPGETTTSPYIKLRVQITSKSDQEHAVIHEPGSPPWTHRNVLNVAHPTLKSLQDLTSLLTSSRLTLPEQVETVAVYNIRRISRVIYTHYETTQRRTQV